MTSIVVVPGAGRRDEALRVRGGSVGVRDRRTGAPAAARAEVLEADALDPAPAEAVAVRSIVTVPAAATKTVALGSAWEVPAPDATTAGAVGGP